MKKNIFKRCVCGIVAVATAISFTACGKEEIPLASKENIYSTTEIDIPDNFDYISRMSANGENIFILGDKNEIGGDEENPIYSNQTMLTVLDLNGTEISTTAIAKSDENSTANRYISQMCIGDDGFIYMLVNESSWNEETMESTNKYFICKYDINGNLQSEIDVSNLDPESEDDYVYYNTMVIGNDGYYYISAENSILVSDGEGKLIYKVKSDEGNGENSGSYINSLNKTGDGRIVAIFNSYTIVDDIYTTTNTAKVIDAATQSFSAEYNINSNYHSFYNGSDNADLYVSRENSLCSLDLETGEITTVIDWLKSGFDTTTMDNAAILSDGRILCTSYKYDLQGNGYSWSDNDMVISILSQVDPATVPDKQLITVSAWYIDYRIKQRIVDFNKTNPTYQIEVTTYNDYDDGTGSYDAGLTKLNNDLISGNIPDIILLDSDMPIDSYISKGILADLYPFMEKDESINKENYLTNVLDALSVGGKLYSIAPSFTIQTISAKKSIVGDKQGWTMADFKAVAEANPDAQMFSEMTQSNFITYAMVYSMDSYVNRETGECSFNSDSFKTLLEMASSYPKEIDYSAMYDSDPDYWIKREMSYRENKTILRSEYIYDFSSIKQLEQGYFGEPVTYIGFPCDNGNGSALSINCQVAITDKAKNPDGAWEFIKYFISEEYQNSLTGELPIMESAYGKIMENAKKKPSYIDENGKEVEYDNTFWLGETEFKLDVNTDEDNQRMMDYVKTVTSVYRYDTDLMNIITEEAEAYFSGQKSVDEVVDIIQNRASIFVSESR